jgi:hypothetical protein
MNETIIIGLNMRGVNFHKLSNTAFDMKGLKQETIVNLGN